MVALRQAINGLVEQGADAFPFDARFGRSGRIAYRGDGLREFLHPVFLAQGLQAEVAGAAMQPRSQGRMVDEAGSAPREEGEDPLADVLGEMDAGTEAAAGRAVDQSHVPADDRPEGTLVMLVHVTLQEFGIGRHRVCLG